MSINNKLKVKILDKYLNVAEFVYDQAFIQ